MIPIRDTAPCNIRPWVTWVIMAICIVVFIAMQVMPHELSYRLIYLYGMVPIRYSDPHWALSFGLPDDHFLSFLTSLFLHGNWWHLAINMIFMWIFADNVEDRMGHGPFLFFYLLCGLCATFLQWYFDPRLAIPVVGASGAIAGVLAAYFFLYPLARVIVWIPLFFLPIVIHIPAVAFLGLWVIIQLHEATTSVIFEGVTVDVAWWAHLGGFITGSILYRLFVRNEPMEEN